MAILVQCSHCARGFQVRDELGGRQVRCQCGEDGDGTRSIPRSSACWTTKLDVKLDPTTCTTARDWIRAARSIARGGRPDAQEDATSASPATSTS